MKWLLSLAALLLCLSTPTAAHANPREARRLFAEATRALEAADYRRALELYRESFAAHENSGALYGMARAQRGMRRHADALVTLERYVRAAGPSDRPSVEDVRGEIAELRRLIGALELDIEPAGARVEIDGEAMGVAPLAAPLLLAPGVHILTVNRPGHQAHLEEIEIVAGETERRTVRLVARRDFATAIISARPDAGVFMDGVAIGETPFSRRLEPGPHVFRFVAAGYHTRDLEVALAPGQRRRLHVDLLEDTVWTHPAFWTIVGALLVGGAVAGGYAIWWIDQRQLHGNLDPPVVMLLRGP